jgi:hypothetical protein
VDLFVESNNYTPGTYPEQGAYQVNGNGTWVGFQADSSQTSGTQGYKTLQIDQLVTSITFKAPGYTNFNNQDNEFAVASLTFLTPSSAVPELDGRSAFGAVGLLFVGLMVGTSRRRRLNVRPGV